MFICCECCVLSGRDLCDGLITRPEESYRLVRVVVCNQDTSKNEEAKARYRAVENTTTMGCNARKTNNHSKLFNSLQNKLKCNFVTHKCLNQGDFCVLYNVEDVKFSCNTNSLL
jgi:hypothetical protein